MENPGPVGNLRFVGGAAPRVVLARGFPRIGPGPRAGVSRHVAKLTTGSSCHIVIAIRFDILSMWWTGMAWPTVSEKDSPGYVERERSRHAWDLRRAVLGLQYWGRSYFLGPDDLGLSERTVYRYEGGKAPRWYLLALIGLAYLRRHGSAGLPEIVREGLEKQYAGDNPDRLSPAL